MANKQKTVSSSIFFEKPKITRPGVHSKTKTSNNKQNKNYMKRYRGQG
jgi:hypothetical protein